jgi:hypothetical protein
MATNDSPSADQMVGENAGALSRQLDERVNRLIESCCIGVDDVYYHDDSYAIHPQVLAAAIRLATSMVKEHGADASKVACALPMSSVPKTGPDGTPHSSIRGVFPFRPMPATTSFKPPFCVHPEAIILGCSR